MSKTAFSDNLRPVDVVVQPNATVTAPIGAYKACLDFVERIEEQVATGTVSNLRDLDVVGGTSLIFKDLNQDVWYNITITTMAVQSASYEFTVLGTYTSLEEATAALPSGE